MILENKVALVTGGTSGIGKATALAFGAAGAKVVFSGRREAEGEATATLIRDAGAECLFVRSDVSSETEVKALVEKTVATEMNDRSLKQIGMTVDSFASTVPMGRIGQAEEIAQAVVFLCSDAASYMTGQPFVVDGGSTAS